MKKKGFTLIELLAVIVILAIIAIISMPIITDLINKSRYGAFGVTKKNIEHAAELYYAKNADDVLWEDDISYVTIGTLKSKKFLRNSVINTLDSTSISDDTKVLLYRKGRKIDYSLQLYDEQFFDWYQGQMVQASKSEDITLPTTVGDKITVDLATLMGKGLVDELRLPLELGNRCVGYVEIEKTTDNYEYNAYVDCLQGASTFASHYLTFGGKYNDSFNDIKETSDGGYIAVGNSNSEYIGELNLYGQDDAIITKFNNSGVVEWSHNFGGSGPDRFEKVIETTDGYIAVGRTESSDHDLDGMYIGGDNDAIITKYDFNGNLVFKKTYGTTGTNGGEVFNDIIKVNDGYVLIGSVNINKRDGDLLNVTIPGSRSAGIIIKMNNDFETVWRSFFAATYYEYFYSFKKTSDNGYIVVGASSSNNYDMEGIGWTGIRNNEAIILKYDATGNLQYKNGFGGSANDSFRDIVEVTDGYVAVGYGTSIDDDMEGLNNGEHGINEAIIVKYDKNFNLIWKKSLGGTNNDGYESIYKQDDNNLIVVGYTQSNDYDLSDNNLSTNGYNSGLIVKYNGSGDLVTKKYFGGTSSEFFNTIIKTSDNELIVSGNSYSNDKHLQKFNKGNSDAILVSYDLNLNLIKILSEKVVIIEKIKPIIANYGTSISSKYAGIYTTNNPEVDLGSWCTNNNADVPENKSNYIYGGCLIPFNSDDRRLLTNIETTSYKRVYAGEYEYAIDNKPNNIYNWHRIIFYFSGSSNDVELSNLKLKFEDGYIGSISEAVTNNYIEPLVAVSNSMTDRITGFMPTIMDIINPAGTTGMGNYPTLNINLKPKKSRLVSVFVTSSKDSINNDGMAVYELRNFDMSITPTE
ncbi:MAG: prepilin-type N-terminal cleavage/methylation domain-containing protein [Bacilli bacterium]|nr:prepilin-type N-terminal cleavage/methylation domain-containing protein [Bacilli bacterium]